MDQPFQMLVSSIDYNEFVGRIAIGRIERGTLKQNQEIAVCNYHDPDAAPKKAKAVSIYEFDGSGPEAGDGVHRRQHHCHERYSRHHHRRYHLRPRRRGAAALREDQRPHAGDDFLRQRLPLCRPEGKFVTSRQLRDRLYRETLKDVSLKVTDTDRDSAFNVAGRGEMSLSILIETMRREGYEFQVSPPACCTRRSTARSASLLSVWWWTCPATAWAASSRSWASARATWWR